MGQAAMDSEAFYNALDQCDTNALQNLLGGVKDAKQYLHQVVGSSTRLPIEIVTYSSASPDRINATLKLLIDHGLDVNFIKDSPNPPFSLIAIDSSPEVVKYLLEKGMKFDGKAQYPAENWCNYQVAHLIHNTPEPCSTNNFEQKDYPADYNHNMAKLKLDLFNYIADPETKNAFVRLMEKRSVLEYNKIRGEYRENNVTLGLPTLDDKKVKCQIHHKTRIENNGSEKFSLTIKLQKSHSDPDTMIEFIATYSVNAYDGCDTTPRKRCEGSQQMARLVKEYFDIAEDDFYGFVLLLMHHIDCGTLVEPRGCRKRVLYPSILSLSYPAWLEQIARDWARAPIEEESSSDNEGDDYDGERITLQPTIMLTDLS